MKIRMLFMTLTLGLPLFAFANTSHASNKYTTCSDSQIASLNSLVRLATDENSDDRKYQSCLLIDPKNSIFLVAKSNQLSVDKDENGNNIGGTYDLTLYLIDGFKQKILNQNLLLDDIISDALHFDGIELDTTPFSTLPNKNVVGLLQKHSHNGGISHGNDDLQLLYIDGANIRPVGIIMVNDYVGTRWDDACGGKGNHYNHTKNTLILSDKTHNGLQDIIVKSQKINEGVAGKACKPFKKLWQKQQTVKFNGKEYNFTGIGLENDGV